MQTVRNNSNYIETMQLISALGVMDPPRTESILGQPHRSSGVETRLIIAYSLIALMVAFAIIGGMVTLRRRDKKRRRDAGHGGH
jgi:hypothetical protein